MRRLGVEESKIEGLTADVPDPHIFSEKEIAAIELADRLFEAGQRVDEELWARLNRLFSYGEIIELVCSAGLFNYFNRLNDALRTDITR